jgi:hypothetical protein
LPIWFDERKEGEKEKKKESTLTRSVPCKKAKVGHQLSTREIHI